MIFVLKNEFIKLARFFGGGPFLFTFLFGNLVLFSTTTLVFLLEHGTNPHMKSYWDSLWWGVSTITTVGFGDIVPITFSGRLIGIGLMYTGTVLFVTFTGMLVSHWLKKEVEEEILPLEIKTLREEQKEMKRLLEQLHQKIKTQSQNEVEPK